MIKIFTINFRLIYLFFAVTFFSSYVEGKNIVDVIKEDSELSVFYSHLKKNWS